MCKHGRSDKNSLKLLVWNIIVFFMTVGSSLFLENTSSSEIPSKSLRRTSRDRLLAVRKVYYDYCSNINRFYCKTKGLG